jgi:hypothetical protein
VDGFIVVGCLEPAYINHIHRCRQVNNEMNPSDSHIVTEFHSHLMGASANDETATRRKG